MQQFALIPKPRSLELLPDFFKIPKKWLISSRHSSNSWFERLFTHLLKILNDKGYEGELILKHFPINLNPTSFSPTIEFSLIIPEENVNIESYFLDITSTTIVLTATHDNGLFWGLQTLAQILEQFKNEPQIPCCKIQDEPAFSFRGFMHDVGRNFYPISQLQVQLEIFSRYKLNYFHWHLTDNPAWRIESKCYPQLNDPRFQLHKRSPGQFYTYEQIRDLILYARRLNIQIIPEIDMPGHSLFFKRAFKTSMNSFRGMRILTDLLNEFLTEIPGDLAPFIHIGSDEVHIWNRAGFIKKISELVKNNNRQIIMWSPGLSPTKDAILQNWTCKTPPNPLHRNIDSTFHYINHYEPLSCVHQLYFHPPCGVDKGDDKYAWGAMLCHWPDVRVIDRHEDLKHNPIYPAVLTFAERTWNGGIMPHLRPKLTLTPDHPLLSDFMEFEDRLCIHARNYFHSIPFPYQKQSHIKWKLLGPFPISRFLPDQPNPEKIIQESYVIDGKSYQWQEVLGGSIILQLSGLSVDSGFPNHSPVPKKNALAYALTYLYSEKECEISFWIGFDMPSRAHRCYAGIPNIGEWDANGGMIWINNLPLNAPKWNHPGEFHQLQQLKRYIIGQEDPYIDEEFYWSRSPVPVHLQQGWNKILIRIPKSYGGQTWGVICIPIEITETNNEIQPNISFSTDLQIEKRWKKV